LGRLIELNEEEEQYLEEAVSEGNTLIEEEEVQERLDICEDCEYHNTEDLSNFCEVCGCMTKIRAHLLEEGCPMAKWPGDVFRD
jgi:hypothetical protein